MKEKTTIKQKHMKKILMMFALLLGVSAAWAQQSSGDYYEGLTRKIGFSQMIPPHGLEITYDKTVHVIFPAPVKYVDLGSTNLIAGKADGAENVIRVKATTRNFREETNMSVITEDGNFYTFNVKYADEPLLLNVEMCDFIHDGESVNRPNNAMEIYLTELDNESPRLVRLIMKSVYENDKRRIRHIGCKRFGIQYLLKGLYTHNDLLYFHTQVKNSSNVPFDVDFITFKVVDKKVMIDIKDTGKGIPKSNWKRIFEPGFTTKTRGWGLGLSLSRRVIEEYHQGRIGVVYSELGKGTDIRITLKRYFD
jgi:conjugative transposon TraN protein